MLELYTYQLQFNQPFKTGSTSFNKRSGLIIRFRDSSCDAISEAAPLPGFSKDHIDQIKSTLVSSKDSIQHFFKTDFDLSDLKLISESNHKTPSLQFALEMLGIEILCQRNRSSISKLLDLPVSNRVNVNAVIGTGSEDEIHHNVESDFRNGFRVFKIKVGNHPKKLAKTLHNLHLKFPAITFRLDANQTWPIEKVKEYSKLFVNLPVEYIEEPAAFKSEIKLNSVIDNCDLPVALDESISDLISLSAHIENEKIQIFVMKPTIFGSILNLIDTFSSRKHLYNKLVITSAFESGIGLNQLSWIAAIVGTKEKAHGLNTYHYFKNRLVEKFVIKNAKITFPEIIGFGINFDDIDNKMLKSV